MKSDEDPRAIIRVEDYPRTRLLCNDMNLGFAGGNNWGMRLARGEYMLLLNNDTEVTPDLIEKLLIPFKIDCRTGVVSPKIKYFEPNDKIQYAGFTKMNKITGRTRMIGNGESDRGQFDEIKPTWGAHGAAMMVKTEIIEKVGMLPEKFFLYYEEWDWSTRIRTAGYRIYFQGLATVFHKESISVGKLSPMKEYYLTRNRILYMRRNTTGLNFWGFILFFTFFTFPKTTCKYLVKGNFLFLNAFIRGIKDNMLMSAYSSI